MDSKVECHKSPKWKRPSDIMKLRKKKVATLPQKVKCSIPTKDKNTTNKKRFNPFGCQDSLSKKIKIDTSNECDSVLGREVTNHLPSPPKDLTNGMNEDDLIVQSTEKDPLTPDTVTSNEKVDNEQVIQNNHTFPCDWSLKTKIRFISPKSFSWCHPIKSVQEANGLMSFVAGKIPYTEDINNTNNLQEDFVRNCMVWMYPNIPWLKLFPRMVNDNQISKIPSVLNDDITKVLHSDWSEAFTSIFHQLRAEQCPYFYLLGHQFTVLFQGDGVGGDTCLHAMVTPTTRGFREALTTEGIEFIMPFMPSKNTSNIHENDSPDTTEHVKSNSQVEDSNLNGQVNEENTKEGLDNNDDNDDDDDDDDKDSDNEAGDWLESMGLDRKEFPSLEARKVKLQQDCFRTIDNRPESMLVIKDNGDTQALFNFLLNCRSCIAVSGAQTGIPPTILAPKAFKGATLKPLKVHQSEIKQRNSEGSMTSGYTLEVSGPILPHTVHGLANLFQLTHREHFTAYFSVHEQTAAFNGLGLIKTTEEIDDIPDSSEFVEMYKVNNLEKTALRELTNNNGLYSWTT